MIRDGKIQIIEIFKSLNGEAYNAGFPCVFVRTMGCNLRCEYHSVFIEKELSGLCDTPESLSYENYKLMYPSSETAWLSANEIFNQVDNLEKDWRYKSVCITGGEPLLECNKNFMINELIPLFLESRYDVGIETNGSINYAEYKEKFGSPCIFQDGHREGLTLVSDYKLPSTGMESKMCESNFLIYDQTDVVKLVISNDEKDWECVNKLLKIDTDAWFYLSPVYENVDTEKMWNFVANHADKKIRFQLQLHKYAFKNPNKKGV